MGPEGSTTSLPTGNSTDIWAATFVLLVKFVSPTMHDLLWVLSRVSSACQLVKGSGLDVWAATFILFDTAVSSLHVLFYGYRLGQGEIPSLPIGNSTGHVGYADLYLTCISVRPLHPGTAYLHVNAKEEERGSPPGFPPGFSVTGLGMWAENPVSASQLVCTCYLMNPSRRTMPLVFTLHCKGLGPR